MTSLKHHTLFFFFFFFPSFSLLPCLASFLGLLITPVATRPRKMKKHPRRNAERSIEICIKKIPRQTTEDLSQSSCQIQGCRITNHRRQFFKFALLFLTARFATMSAEPFKGFTSSRKALPTRNRVLDRKVWDPIFFMEGK